MNAKKTKFFRSLNEQGLAVTYDDVRLRTIVASNKRIPSTQADVKSRFSRNVGLKVPIVSSPMDTVTTSDMAIAMAMCGGLGIVHSAFDIEKQRAEVRRVKLHRNGMIKSPITINQNISVNAVLAMRAENKYEFSTFPVVDDEDKLVGIFSKTDAEYCLDKTRAVHEHMTPLDRVVFESGRITPKQAFAKMLENNKLSHLPVVDKKGKITGLYVKSDVLRSINDNPKNYNLDSDGRLMVGAAVPTDPDEAVARIQAMIDYIDVVVIDTANGNSRYMYDTLKRIKKEFKIDVVAGNVSEGDSAYQLAKAGADGIRVGQGGGSICTTRRETGIGTPQVTAVYECAKAVRRFDIPVCADGGIKEKGDIPIALAAGAESVMLGNMLAATKESSGEKVVLENGTVVVEYRGMGSPSALRDSAASRKRYGAGTGAPLPEGVETQLLYKGSVHDVLPAYIKALRKAMEYVGAPNVRYLRDETLLWRITNAGFRESQPHDI